MTHTAHASPADVAAALGLASLPADWADHWAEAEGAFTPGATAFLDEGFVREACAYARMSPDVTDALVDSAACMASNLLLTRLAFQLHWLLFVSKVDVNTATWIRIPACRLFCAVVLLSGVPGLRKMNAARGIDEAVTLATLADLELWIREATRREGVWCFRNLSWLVYHLQGKLFTLGRLQYLPGTFPHPFRFFRHRGTRRVIALAEDGLCFRADGQFAGTVEASQSPGLFTSRLEEDAPGGILRTLRGNPVDPRGHVLSGLATLTFPDWEEILRPGDPVLTVHIPASGPMDPESCTRSFAEAARFFPAHFPDVPWRAFTCHSWLLDAQFEALDPPPANIVAFLRGWYLHPTEGAGDGQMLERVFDWHGDGDFDLAAAARTTTLQRAIAAFMEAGGRCRDAGSVFFADDLPFAPNRYRES
jgi:hypothetical protein